MKSCPLACAATFIASSAFATGGVYCNGVSDDSVSAYLTVGRVPGFVVVDTRITAAGTVWSMSDLEGAKRVELVQGAIAGEFIIADYADVNVEKIVASLRLARIETELDVAGAGVLSIPSVGAWPVICEFE